MERFPHVITYTLASLLVFLGASPSPADELAQARCLDRWKDERGTEYFAIAVADAAPASPRAIDLAIFVDMSASQAGSVSRAQLSFVEKLLGDLIGGSRVLIHTSRDDAPLMDSPSAVGSPALKSALEKLRRQSPMGTFDVSTIVSRLDPWLDDKSGDLPKRILFVGSGSSTTIPLSHAQSAPFIDRLVAHKVAFHYVAAGREVDRGSLQSIAVRTGGTGRDLKSSETVAKEVLNALARPVLYDARVTLNPPAKELLPNPLPPMRSDVATLIVGVGFLIPDSRIRVAGNREGEAAARDVAIAFEEPAVDARYLGDLVARWKTNPARPALFDPFTTLERARTLHAARGEAWAAQGKAALANRELENADAFFRAVLAAEPDHLEASVGVKAVERLRQGPDPRPQVDVTGRAGGTRNDESSTGGASGTQASKEPSQDLLEEAKAKAAIERQFMVRTVTEALEQARKSGKTDPAAATRILKTTLEALQASGVDDETKAKLRSRLESQLRMEYRRARSAALESLERDRAASRADAQAALVNREVTRQARQKQLIRRFQSLLEAGDAAGAAALADDWVREDPGSPVAVAAKYRGQLFERINRIEDVENAKQRGWWNTLAAAEDSSIPQPDDVPMLFPSAKEWEELTVRREKYKSFDLSPVSPAEESIRRALSRPVSFSFRDTPLEDVVRFFHDLTGANIVIDQAGLDAEGVDLDQPISLELEHVTLKSALRLLLRPLNLTYLIRDDVLQITSIETADSFMVTKVYPVADLVIPIQNFSSGGFGLNGFNMNNNSPGGPGLQGGGGFNQGQGQGLGGGGGGFGGFNRDISDELRQIIDAIGDNDQAKAGDISPWDKHFAANAETMPSLRGAVDTLLKSERYEVVVDLLTAAMRHQDVPNWAYDALALAAQLYGSDASTIRSAILSRVDRYPHDLPLRWSAAQDLFDAGLGADAVSLLRETAIASPPSVNTLYLLAELAGRMERVDETLWAADQIFSREWIDGDHTQQAMRDLLRRLESEWRLHGQAAAADRLRQVAELSRRRDIEINVQWEGEADIDLAVVEPSGLLCSPITPRTPGGGILSSSNIDSRERYTAVEALDGRYEVRLLPVWGAPVGGVATVDVIIHKGSPDETRQRHVVKLPGAPEPVAVDLQGGRRQQLSLPSADAQLVLHRNDHSSSNPRIALRRMLETGQIDVDPAPPRQPGAFAGGRSVPFVTGIRGAVGGGAVAFDPVVEVLQDGTTLSAQAVVSADRRFVRITAIPLVQSIQSIEDVRTIQVGGTAGGGVIAP